MFHTRGLPTLQPTALQGTKLPLEGKVATCAVRGGQILPGQVRKPDALKSGFRKSFVPWYSLHLGPYLGAIKNGQKNHLTSATGCSPLDSTEGRLESPGANRIGTPGASIHS